MSPFTLLYIVQTHSMVHTWYTRNLASLPGPRRSSEAFIESFSHSFFWAVGNYGVKEAYGNGEVHGVFPGRDSSVGRRERDCYKGPTETVMSVVNMSTPSGAAMIAPNCVARSIP